MKVEESGKQEIKREEKKKREKKREIKRRKERGEENKYNNLVPIHNCSSVFSFKPAKMSMSKTSKMLSFINCRMKVTINDSRVISGKFMAFDKHMNLILGDAEEWRRTVSKTRLKEERDEKRTLGLVLIRGDSVVSLSVEGPPIEDNKGRVGGAGASGGPAGVGRAAARGIAIPAPGARLPGLGGPVRGVGGPSPQVMLPLGAGPPRGPGASPVSAPPMTYNPGMIPGRVPPPGMLQPQRPGIPGQPGDPMQMRMMPPGMRPGFPPGMAPPGMAPPGMGMGGPPPGMGMGGPPPGMGMGGPPRGPPPGMSAPPPGMAGPPGGPPVRPGMAGPPPGGPPPGMGGPPPGMGGPPPGMTPTRGPPPGMGGPPPGMGAPPGVVGRPGMGPPPGMGGPPPGMQMMPGMGPRGPPGMGPPGGQPPNTGAQGSGQ